MASHGVRRTQALAPRSQASREKELQDIEEYKSLIGKVSTAIEEKNYSDATLALTSQLLIKNPEYYTIWNRRRQILKHILSLPDRPSAEASPQKDIETLLTAELDFILPLLIGYPKCYWIWNHRLWLLQQFSKRLSSSIAQTAWSRELNLVGKMLARDGRNFHGWSYRRTVIAELRKLQNEGTPSGDSAKSVSNTHNDEASAPTEGSNPASSLTETEFTYTEQKIRENLSNFSAWHNRSKLIPQLLNERGASPAARNKMFNEELTFLKNGLLMDPQDQSLWFYHQYLMSVLMATSGNEICWAHFSNHDRLMVLEQEITDIREVLEDFEDCRWIYQYLLKYATHYLEMEGSNDLITRRDMRQWLVRLKELDPLRKGRWDDLGASLNL